MKRATFLAALGTGLVLSGIAFGASPTPASHPPAIQMAAAQTASTGAFDPSVAASAAEDMIDFALAGDAGRVEERVLDLRNQTSALRQTFGDATAGSVESRLASIETALGKGDFVQVALQANEAFRAIVEARGPDGTVPLEVSLLDYSGFKLKTLSTADQVDWEAVKRAADEEARFWTAMTDKVADKGLRDLMNSLQEGLAQGVAEEDATQVAFAAQMLLDAVDLLEKAFA